MEHVTWVVLISLIAVGEFVILLTMPDHPITEFIPPRVPERRESETKVRMIQYARTSGSGLIKLFINGSGWIEGTVLDLSESHGVLLLRVGSSETGNELVYLKDIVRVSTIAKRLGPQLADEKPFPPERSSHTPKDVH